MTLQSGAQPAFCRAESKAICRPVTCGLSYPSFQVTPLGRAKAMKTHPSVAWLQEGCRNRFLLGCQQFHRVWKFEVTSNQEVVGEELIPFARLVS